MKSKKISRVPAYKRRPTHRKTNRSGYLRLIAIAGALLVTSVIIAWIFREELHDSLVDESLFGREIAEVAAQYDLDPDLVKAVIFVESGFDANAIGGVGEIGLMQIVPVGPGAAGEYARVKKISIPSQSELFDPALNLEIGCWYLRRALDCWSDYKYHTEMALAEYNAGRSRVREWKPANCDGEFVDQIRIKSTRHYVKKVMRKYHEFQNEKKN